LGSRGPGLDELEDFGAHFGIHGAGTDGLEQRNQALHELSGGDFGEKVRTAIFNAGVGELVELAAMSWFRVRARG
jgi:hypothetical protein